MNTIDYWKECIAEAACDCGLAITEDQLNALAEAVQSGHENYGMAFYSPPSTDRISEIEREHKQKLAELERKHEKYRENAEEAVRMALRQRVDENVSIGEHGEVFRHGGRTTQIQ